MKYISLPFFLKQALLTCDAKIFWRVTPWTCDKTVNSEHVKP